MYLLIGRTHDYAWSLTSADHDVRDVFAEQLCEPDGTAPTRASDHYLTTACAGRSSTFDAGTAERDAAPVPGLRARPGDRDGDLERQADRAHPQAVDVRPRRPEPRRAQGHDRGQGDERRRGSATSRTSSASPSTGRMPRVTRPRTSRRGCCRSGRRASTAGCRRSAPGSTSGAGSSAVGTTRTAGRRPDGLLLNWNNQSAPGFMHGDDDPYGSVHRVELFDQFPAQGLAGRRRERHEPRRDRGRPRPGLAGREPGAAHRSGAEPARRSRWWRCSTTGSRATRRRSTRTTTGSTTRPGPTIMDALWTPIADAVMRPQFGDLTGDLDAIRGLGSLSGESYVDKDLRTLLGATGAREVPPALLRQGDRWPRAGPRCGRPSTRWRRAAPGRAGARPGSMAEPGAA